MSTEKVATLLNPTSVAILGARENPSGWTARIFANLIRFDFDGPVYPVNPNHERMWGVECFPDLRSLPRVPDHLVVMRAAASVAGILREAAAMGTRSATLYATGFSEAGTDAKAARSRRSCARPLRKPVSPFQGPTASATCRPGPAC